MADVCGGNPSAGWRGEKNAAGVAYRIENDDNVRQASICRVGKRRQIPSHR